MHETLIFDEKWWNFDPRVENVTPFTCVTLLAENFRWSNMMIEIMTVFRKHNWGETWKQFYLIALLPNFLGRIVYVGLNITKLFFAPFFWGVLCVCFAWTCFFVHSIRFLNRKYFLSSKILCDFVERTCFPKAIDCCSCSTKESTP